jgi:adenine phosphoribosyltransferase
MKKVIEALDNQQIILINGYGFVVNSLTEQTPATPAGLLKEVCEELASRIDLEKTNKIVTEEDKGSILVAGISLITGLSFGMARWQPNGLAEQIKQSFKMEYTKGDLYLNGIESGDKVTIIDDLISTGGTIIALIKMIKKIGAEVVDIICVAEKINYGGRAKIKKETGYDIKTLLKIDVSKKYSKVIL